ncbi:MAG TPA: hypothetical protein VM686_39750 [Polyangiaceae bacterium]|nr:hypothetical protein [Polyangiaceae bacterium]
MLDVLEVVVQMVLNIALPASLIRWDEKRLSELQLSRAWPLASFWIAVVAFGPLCLPFHFVRTRRSLLGLLWGVLALVLAILAGALVAGLLGALRPE